MQDQLFSSASTEHDTPADIIERVRYVFDGAIALDPATNDRAQKTIKAERFYTASDDGLVQSWQARNGWLNPPFSVPVLDSSGAPVLGTGGKPKRSRVIAFWVKRWLSALANGELPEAALLIPARTDTEWYRPLFGFTTCYVSGRIKFGDADNGAPFPTAIIYSGPRVDRFYQVFDQIGTVGKFAAEYPY